MPADWLIKQFEKSLTPEEKAAIQKHGWDKLMELFKQRLEEQKERHAGGNKWIGTGGTSPFGNGGYHPEGIRVGGDSAGNRSAVKVWDMRQFRDYDDQVELGTRNFKVALRRLRRFAREGAELELDLDDTIASTARNAGHLDLRMVPERHNTVKVLMLLDVGGSMDDHITRVEELFSAARSEFRNLDVYYFHNCPYESLWQSKPAPQQRALRHLGRAAQVQPGLAAHHRRRRHHEPIRDPAAGRLGRALQRRARRAVAAAAAGRLAKSVWLNPEPTASWQYRQSIALLRDIMQDRMYPVTVAGLEQAMRVLSK